MIILRNKLFALVDKDKDGDYDFDDVKLQYKDWRQNRTGYPNQVLIGTAGLTGLSAYGGSKLAENIATKKAVKEVEKKAKENAIRKAKESIGKVDSKGRKITSEDIKRLFKDPIRAEKFIKKHGDLDRVGKEVSNKLSKKLKGIKTKGAIATGVPVLATGLILSAREQNIKDKFNNNPKKLEIGYVNLVNKKKG